MKIVNHPLFGRGQIAELRHAAREAVVNFDNGIRTVVQTGMLSGLDHTPTASAPQLERATPDDAHRIEARRTIEALRYGIVPTHRIRELSVGVERERASLQEAFETNERAGGDVRIVLGEYGAGKSHFFELAAQEALARNFIVATASLDLREVPPNRPQRIYNRLIRSLRYPDFEDTGALVPLLERIVGQPALFAALVEDLRGTIFATALHNYSLMRTRPGEELELLFDWISGEKVFIKNVRDALAVKGKEYPAPALPQMTTTADQYCYMLNGWGWLAHRAGYAGLAVLIDESEHYSLLNARGQERADNFFKGLIYTALGTRGDARLREDDLQHQHRPHPFRLNERSQIVLMFAVTPSANTFDYRRWLNENQILELDGHLSAAALDDLMARLFVTHQQAHAYEANNRHPDISQALLQCLDSRLINLRQTIRLAVEIYDLTHAHADFTAAHAVTELRRALLGEESR